MTKKGYFSEVYFAIYDEVKKMRLGYQFESLDDWKGKWIYTKDHDYFLNIYKRFRKKFYLLRGEIKSAVIRISGDTRYILWVNGILVSRGPAKGYPWIQPYDTVNIKDYLKAGKNCLAVLLHVWGVSTFSSVWRGRGGLIVDGEVILKGGKSVRLDSNDSWLGLNDLARSSEGIRLSKQQSYQEIIDARKDIPKNISFYTKYERSMCR